MPSYPRIESYYKELEDIIQFGGSDNELNIRKAFQDCLSEYCSIHRENLKLIPELAAAGGIPDGTVKDSLRMARGYREAKDTHDDIGIFGSAAGGGYNAESSVRYVAFQVKYVVP